MKTGIGQSKYRDLTLCHVVWSVPAKVFLTVTFSILYILTDHDLFGSNVEQDCSYTVFAVFFFTLTKHSSFVCNSVRICKTNDRWRNIFADISASVPTRKENMHVPYGTKTTQEIVKGLIYPWRSRMITIKVNEYEITENSAGSNDGTGILRFSGNVI